MVGSQSSELVQEQDHGVVRVLTLSRPPVNALNVALMLALETALRRANADPACRAVVLTAAGPNFSAGSDVTELGRVAGAGLPPLCAAIEGSGKPVVAAISGTALGGATELVLAAHGRVAHVGARLGLPEISLGLLPVAGSTQRLPRLVGAEVALRILLEGAPLTATEALAVGLLDAVVEEPPLRRALALAETLALALPRRTAERRDGLRDPMAFQMAVKAARSRFEGARQPAPWQIIDCVEAALVLPFDQGCALEQTLAADMAASDEAQGLRHAFLAERRALFPPAEIAAVAPPKLETLAILGANGPACDVARMALAAGLGVTLVEQDRGRLAVALQKIAARQEALVAEGQMKPAQRDADWARLTGLLAGDGIGPCDLVLVSPDAPRLAEMPGPAVALGGKGPVVLSAAMAAGHLATLAVSATAAHSLAAAALAFGRRLGWKVLVQGQGSPMDLRLREVLSRAIAALEAQGTERATLVATLAAYGLGSGARMKLPPQPAGAGDILGFCLAALMNEGARLVEEKVARRPSDVDAAALLSGLFPRWEGGPLFRAEKTGLMGLRADLRRRAEGAPDLFTPAPILDRLIADGMTLTDLNRT